MIFRISLCLALFAFVRGQSNCDSTQAEPWSYSGSNGPDQWGNNFPQCNGRSQSPIDIRIEDTEPNSSPEDGEISLFGYETPVKGKVENNGHTVQVTPSDDVARGVVINGDTYNLRQFHFHFGSGNTNGTEHLIDGQGYVMELHFVHMNSRDEIAVIGILFRVGRKANRHMMSLVKSLANVRYKNDATDVSDVCISRLFPTCAQPVFFTYSGSLTTPACAEGVKWFVVNGVTNISMDQMRRFRQLNAVTAAEGTCPMADNVRPVQPLNDRTVTAYSGECLIG